MSHCRALWLSGLAKTEEKKPETELINSQDQTWVMKRKQPTTVVLTGE
jgi:hypothetical protein